MILLAFQRMLRIMHINPSPAPHCNRPKIKPIFAKAHSCATRRHKYIERHFPKTKEAGRPLNKLEHQNFRAAVLEFTDRTTWQNPYAVTLTLKQATSNNGAYTKIDAIRASETLRHFRNRLNRSLLGKSSARSGQHIPCFAVYEGTTDVRPHYHLCLDRPANIHVRMVRVRDTKRHGTPLTLATIRSISSLVQTVDGWIKYMTKRQTKTDFTSSIDWNNTQLGA